MSPNIGDGWLIRLINTVGMAYNRQPDNGERLLLRNHLLGDPAVNHHPNSTLGCDLHRTWVVY